MTTRETRLLGRAKNVVLQYLEERLVVPKIYLDADWAGEQVDVLAIDRAGAGDVSVVLLAPVDLPESASQVDYLTTTIKPLLDRFEFVPAQYKYVAVVDIGPNERFPLPGLPHPINDLSFSPDGIGRISFLVVGVREGEESYVKVVFKPERFRAKIAKLANEYVQQHEADCEIRA